MNSPSWKRDELTALDYLSIESAQTDCAVVLLHGYGADCSDLAPLAQYLDAKSSNSWFFPNGFLEVPIGPHVSGRAWFPINMERLQLAQSTGEFERYLAAHIPDGFLEASEKITSFISGLKGRFKKVILGGFSQGSMIGAQVALNRPELVDGLILLSSTFVSESAWRGVAEREIGYPILQTHGTFDPILPYKDACRLSEFLKEHTSDFQFISFQGGHEIPPPVLEAMNKLISKVCGANA